VAVLAPGELKLAGISCDRTALIAALVEDPDATGHRPVVMRLCPFRRPCEDLNPPELAGSRLYYPADVARVGGDIVIAKAFAGITRVTSSRDGGNHWMPWTVAFDALLSPEASGTPFRLLVAGDTVLLYSGSVASERYPLLISTDHGASFSAPTPTSKTDAVAQFR
jgi:hypothetical protein